LRIEFNFESEKKVYVELLDIIDTAMVEYLSATVNSIYYYELLGVLKKTIEEGKVKNELNDLSINFLLGIT
jgi:hypothetical protein